MSLFNDRGQLSVSELERLETLAQQQQVQAVASAYGGVQLVPTPNGCYAQPFDTTAATPAPTVTFSGACITTTIDLDVVSGSNYLNFNTERFDTDAYYNLGTSGSRLTVPQAGYYLIGATARILFPAFNATDLNFGIQKNHTGADLAIDGFSAGSAGTLALDLIDVHVTTLALLAAGEYVELHVDLTTSGGGGSTKVINAPYPPEFWIHRLG